MANKTKTIVIFKCRDRNERDFTMDKMNSEKHFPKFELYRFNKPNHTFGGTDYQIKATGTVEDIKAFQEKDLDPYTEILDILKVELEPLRLMFHKQTKVWSTFCFEDMVEINKLSEEELVEIYGCDPEENSRYPNPTVRYIPFSIWETIRKKKYIVKQGLDAFLDDAYNQAEKHFQCSLVKLARRIDTKGLDTSKLTAKTKYSKVGKNIDTTLTDGCQTLRARTIIASGPIQKPHYRYIIT